MGILAVGNLLIPSTPITIVAMQVAILIAPRDFKDETVSKLNLFFDKKDIGSRIASFSLRDCTGYHGAVVKPKIELRDIEPMSYDVLLLVDGPGVDSLKLYDQRPLLDLTKAFHESGKIVAGVGNGVKIIARANILKDTKVAQPDPETEKLVKLYRGVPVNDYLVFDNKILTLSDPDRIDELVGLLAEKAEQK